MSRVEALIFDLDNTLIWDERSINESFQATCLQAAAKVSVQTAALESAVRQSAKELFHESEWFEWADSIELTYLEALWGKFDGEAKQVNPSMHQWALAYQAEAWTRGLYSSGIDNPELGVQLARQFASERRNRPHIYKDTFEVLNLLHSRIPMLLLTNGDSQLQREKIDSIVGLADYFDHIIVSGEFGVGKPSPLIFEYAVKLLGISSGQCMMVGDTLGTDILGANRTGIPNIWINHSGKNAPIDNQPTFEVHNLESIIPIIQPDLSYHNRINKIPRSSGVKVFGNRTNH